jgi:predicted metal-dependent hydrolase
VREQYIAGLGLVKMTKEGRARKNYSIKILTDSTVLVSIPYWGSYKRALMLVEQMRNKIQLHQKKQNEIFDKTQIFSDGSQFDTRFHQIIIRQIEDAHEIKCHRIAKEVSILIPTDADIISKEIQQFIRSSIEEIWRYEAKHFIPQRVTFFAEKFSFSFQNIKINSARTRWGSCSSSNNLNFSLHTMMLPDNLLDYIILHELCHTVHKNHGKEFYNLLNRVTEGHHPILNKALKTYRIGVY